MHHTMNIDFVFQLCLHFVLLHGNGEFRYPLVVFQGFLTDPIDAFHDG